MNVIRSAAVFVLTGLLAAACAGSDEDAAPVNSVAPAEVSDTTSTTSTTTTSTTTTTSSTTTPTTTSTTTTTTAAPSAELTDEEQILDVIERYWATVATAFDPPEPNAETWAIVATFENSIQRLERQQAKLDAGEGTRHANPDGPFVVGGTVTSIDGEDARAFVCVLDDAEFYDLETGDTIESDLEQGYALYETSLRLQGELWLVDVAFSTAWFEGVGDPEPCLADLP